MTPAFLHVASDWPRTFFTPKVFLFSIYIEESILLPYTSVETRSVNL